MLVLDTTTLAPHERAAAFQDAISGHASTSLVAFEDQSDFQATVHFFPLGAGRVFNVDATGNTLRRTARIARRDEQDTIALALPLTGANRFRWGREESVLRPDDLLAVDLDAPYEYGWAGTGTSYAFQVDRDRLGLPADTITRATTRLPASPLYELVRDHVRSLTTHAHRFTDPYAAARAGDVTIELMRALLLTAARDDVAASESRSGVLMHQITTFVRRHLADRDLTPHRIATAHHISLRHLYAVCEQEGIGLESWIIRQRLDAARAALVTPTGRRATIAAIAHQWGFASPSHFTKRFRAEYGLTPSEWREVGQAPRDDPQVGRGRGASAGPRTQAPRSATSAQT